LEQTGKQVRKIRPMSVSLAPRLVGKLRREARRADDKDFLQVLLAESVARRWFLQKGLPCWRTRQPPSSHGRYGLVFPSGRRALASPSECNGYSFDHMAAARCDYLLKVVMEGESSGNVDGFFTLFDVRKPGDLLWKPDLEMLETRPMEEFPELAMKPEHFRRSYILGSLILLLMSELKTPPPGDTGKPARSED